MFVAPLFLDARRRAPGRAARSRVTEKRERGHGGVSSRFYVGRLSFADCRFVSLASRGTRFLKIALPVTLPRISAFSPPPLHAFCFFLHSLCFFFFRFVLLYFFFLFAFCFASLILLFRLFFSSLFHFYLSLSSICTLPLLLLSLFGPSFLVLLASLEKIP